MVMNRQGYMKNTPMIIIKNLRKKLQSRDVLDGVDLEITRGEARVIVGGSGVGKSVLLKHITGLMEADSGSIIVDGIEVDPKKPRNMEQVRDKISMVFQNAALFDSLTVRDNVGFTLINHKKMRDDEVDHVVSEKLELVNLEGSEDIMPSDLSGGMKKRVAIARALATDPAIVLFDEPTTGLDPLTAETINDLICELKQKLEVTQLVVTHDIHSACKIADNISMIRDGKIIATGSVEEMMKNTEPYIHEFMTISTTHSMDGLGNHHSLVSRDGEET
jgi:phospholipid/cholesterol/gamma-HCH transport system ATP-binding protein